MSEVLQHSGAVAAGRFFRDILAAMSRPGKRVALHDLPEGESSLQAGSMAMLATLCDYQTPVFLSTALATVEVMRWTKFDTGATITETPGHAAFAVVEAAELGALLDQFALGSHEYPDRSTTVVVQLASKGSAANVELSGPGVGEPVEVSLSGLGADFWKARAQINAGYPLGLDFIFVQGEEILACPRSATARLIEAH
jgi:alpha-D-ribose 1-methylphosphonate 5-triphosphate synthase subunit PhnH